MAGSSTVAGALNSTRGSARVFTVTELSRASGSLRPTENQFRWSNENFSAPRGPWQYGIVLRTVRKDLPGSEDPSEQVLGWNYTPFTCAGVWDDRHAGSGYAEASRRAFEEMVKRGNPIRIQQEKISVAGLITNLNITWFRSDKVGYSFTLSPHLRFEGETVRSDINPARKITSDPRTSVKLARRGLEALQTTQARARAANASKVQQMLSTDIFREVDQDISEIAESITFAENVVEKEILKFEDAANALNRGAQTMASVKTSISSLHNRVRALTATTALALETTVEVLQFEAWGRGLSAAASRLALTSDVAHRDFETRAQPKPARMHRVRDGETLYTISSLYYGTPHNWRVLLAHNHLTSIILEGGELLSIPEAR